MFFYNFEQVYIYWLIERESLQSLRKIERKDLLNRNNKAHESFWRN